MSLIYRIELTRKHYVLFAVLLALDLIAFMLMFPRAALSLLALLMAFSAGAALFTTIVIFELLKVFRKKG